MKEEDQFEEIGREKIVESIDHFVADSDGSHGFLPYDCTKKFLWTVDQHGKACCLALPSCPRVENS